ncbi:MAG: DNA polymerase III subunit gamma/tau [Gammaproteobacteria bacterium]|nr:DNA polymerase III subunit gamma/tau [Gammaproteobacteria bacterium]
MDYQALYRKYRPQRFSEIVGQDHITETLAREIGEGRVAHAYLFAGPRGTGKTTTARVLAKSLNCPDRDSEGEPCGVCPSCVAITEGSSLDVIELDAASHNSVEDIREMRVSVSTVASVGGAKRVFILDEAHMLSKAAGNALLKTLEEPPEHVHFVLATTEPYKLLDTIRSRSQRFDFRQVPVDVLIAHLRRISASEGYESADVALAAVARRARGSVRDALSLLEQVAALGEGKVEVQGVNRALGLADGEAFSRLSSAITSQDAKAALELIAELSSQGVDLRRFVSEALGYFRGVFLAHYAPNLAEVADEPEATLDEWRKVASELPPPEVLRAVDHLSEALLRLREGREERLMVELALLKLTRPETSADVASFSTRMDRVEQQVRRIQQTAPRPSRSPVVTSSPAGKVDDSETTMEQTSKVEPVPITEPVPTAERVPTTEPRDAQQGSVEIYEEHLDAEAMPPVEGLTIEQFESVWPALVGAVRDELGPRRLAMFREASPGHVEGSTIVLVLPEHLGFHLAQINSDPHIAQIVATRAGELLGGSVQIVFRSSAAAPADVSDQRAPDKDQLVEAPADADPGALVEGLLGGQVIEDIPRD